MTLREKLKNNKLLNQAGFGIILFFIIKGTIVTLLAIGAIVLAL